MLSQTLCFCSTHHPDDFWGAPIIVPKVFCMSPKAIHDKAILPDSPFFFSVFSRADRPYVPHNPFFSQSVAVFLCFAACLGLIRMFRIFYGLKMRKIGMIGFVEHGCGCDPQAALAFSLRFLFQNAAAPLSQAESLAYGAGDGEAQGEMLADPWRRPGRPCRCLLQACCDEKRLVDLKA